MEKLEIEDDFALHERNNGRPRSLFNRKMLRTLVGAVCSIILLKLLWAVTVQPHLSTNSPNYFYLQRGQFGVLPLGGFINTGNLVNKTCGDLRHDGEIQIQQSFDLEDDLLQIATQLEQHPLVKYGQDETLTLEKKVESRWLELSESSAWLENYNAYISISRVVFFNESVKRTPVVSFLRGQLFNQDWVELKNHTIKWQGDEITFPIIFDIPIPMTNLGAFYGPEHPTVIVEEGVDGAEPVVLFNMLTELHNPVQAMHIFRPFTNHLTALTVNGEIVRGVTEKYWSPFFYSKTTPKLTERRWPNNEIHFIQSFKPLRILKCQLQSGFCEWVYEQDVAEDFEETHNQTWGALNGGTNFVPIPMKGAKGTTAFVGFPRTHVPAGCYQGPLSKPEMMVMTVSDDAHFHIDYLSDYIDFRSALLPEEALADVCDIARNLVANSISRWDHSARQDIMTLTLTVGGFTKTLRLHGILGFVYQLPYLKQSLKHDTRADGEALWDYRWSTVGSEVVECSIQALQDRSIELTTTLNFPQLPQGVPQDVPQDEPFNTPPGFPPQGFPPQDPPQR